MLLKRQFENLLYLLTIVLTLKTTTTQYCFVNIYVTSNKNVIKYRKDLNDIRKVVASIINTSESNNKLYRKSKNTY